MTSTIVKKNLMALTGLFLSLFLVIHLLGNLQLLLPAEEAAVSFNSYSRFMSGNPLIKTISYVLYLSIVGHTLLSLFITLQNRKSGGVYAYDNRSNSSRWYSRNMGILGAVILVFLVVHLKDFWFRYKFGDIPLDSNGYRDLYSIVIAAFGQWWYVLLNVLAFIALGYHLAHGIFSAFKTMGAYNNRLTRVFYVLGMALTLILTTGFVFIPIFIYVKYHLS